MLKWPYCMGRTFYSSAWSWFFLSFPLFNAMFVVLYLGCGWTLDVLWSGPDGHIVIQLSVSLSLLLLGMIITVRYAQSKVDVRAEEQQLILAIGSIVVSKLGIEDSSVEFVEKRVAAGRVYNMYLKNGNERFYVGNSIRTPHTYQKLRSLEKLKKIDIQSGKFESQTMPFAWRHAITLLTMAGWVVLWEVLKL